MDKEPTTPSKSQRILVLPRVILDTSVINHLEEGGHESHPLMRALECGYDVILTADTISEIIATRKVSARQALLRRCDWLMQSAKCIWPSNEIVKLLISRHLREPVQFNWQAVEVRARVYEHMLPRRAFSDTVHEKQRSQQFDLLHSFRKLWRQLRPEVDKILLADPTKRPTNYKEAVAIAQRDGGVLWGFGEWLYQWVSNTKPSQTEIESFMRACPPFRAAAYALVMAWYNWSLRDQNDTTPVAGRNDLMMAVYMPYCERFISDDWAHRKDLRLIAEEAALDCQVLSLDEFTSGLILAV